MLSKDWIRAHGQDLDSRKKEYEITEAGRKVVLDELKRLEELIQNGNKIVRGDGV
jgi:DNA-binding PadR family transcriptional regulator